MLGMETIDLTPLTAEISTLESQITSNSSTLKSRIGDRLELESTLSSLTPTPHVPSPSELKVIVYNGLGVEVGEGGKGLVRSRRRGKVTAFGVTDVYSRFYWGKLLLMKRIICGMCVSS